MSSTNKTTPTITLAIAVQTAIANVLNRRGVNMDRLPLIMAQVAHETGNFRHRLGTQYNNVSGIKYSPKSAIKGESDSGVKSPEGNNYSKFDSLGTWAERYYNIVNRGPAFPLQATSVADFADRLKRNRYYTDTVANYTKGLQSWHNWAMKLPKPTLVSGVVVLLICSLIIYNLNGR
jgi:hypothetical protein